MTEGDRSAVSAVMITIGTVILLVPYFIIIGLPIYIGGVSLARKSGDRATKNVFMIPSAIFLILYYGWLLTSPGGP